MNNKKENLLGMKSVEINTKHITQPDRVLESEKHVK